MSVSLEDKELINKIAGYMGTDESVIEKDWQSIQLVAVLSSIKQGGFEPVFSGGTSLSKAYNIINRFSEDLDFKINIPSNSSTRSQRSNYRQIVVDAIRSSQKGWTLDETDIKSGNQSRYFMCKIGYQYLFKPSMSVRPHLKLEMTFDTPALPFITKSLCSFVAQAKNEPPEVQSIACVSPTETAADKLSALVWRVLSRERGTEGDDPTLIRHLYDLAMLESWIIKDIEFKSLVILLFEKDVKRSRQVVELQKMAVKDRLAKALQIMESDTKYRAEYNRFVTGMSYAFAENNLSFPQALQSLQRLAESL